MTFHSVHFLNLNLHLSLEPELMGHVCAHGIHINRAYTGNYSISFSHKSVIHVFPSSAIHILGIFVWICCRCCRYQQNFYEAKKINIKCALEEGEEKSHTFFYSSMPLYGKYIVKNFRNYSCDMLIIEPKALNALLHMTIAFFPILFIFCPQIEPTK